MGIYENKGPLRKTPQVVGFPCTKDPNKVPPRISESPMWFQEHLNKLSQAIATRSGLLDEEGGIRVWVWGTGASYLQHSPALLQTMWTSTSEPPEPPPHERKP